MPRNVCLFDKVFKGFFACFRRKCVECIAMTMCIANNGLYLFKLCLNVERPCMWTRIDVYGRWHLLILVLDTLFYKNIWQTDTADRENAAEKVRFNV